MLIWRFNFSFVSEGMFRYVLQKYGCFGQTPLFPSAPNAPPPTPHATLGTSSAEATTSTSSPKQYRATQPLWTTCCTGWPSSKQKKKAFMKARSIIHTNANPIVPIKLSFCKQSVTQSNSESHRVFSAMGNKIMFTQFPQLVTIRIYQILEKNFEILYAIQLVSHTHHSRAHPIKFKGSH